MKELHELTVYDLREAMDQGELSSYELVKHCLKRIRDIDKSGPRLNAVLEINPDALFLAEAMDAERRAGKVRSALHGMPVLIKDNINTHDKMVTSAGALALADNYAPYDATLVHRLREAGLIILGKTNMTEFANFMSATMKNGYSSRGGRVIHPYNPQADPRGSSTGSAVAVAAGLVPLSVGSETNGSIIYPAHANSIVGIKPTRGLISRYGMIPISNTQDTAGPMARTVADAAALLSILAGKDAHDPSTWSSPAQPEDYTVFLDQDALNGKQIAFNISHQKEWSPAQSQKAAWMWQVFEQAGARLKECHLPRRNSDYPILLHEFKPALNAYLSTCSPRLKCQSLADIIAFNEAHPEQCLAYGQDILVEAERRRMTEPNYIDCLFQAMQESSTEGIDRILTEGGSDFIVSVSFCDAPPVSGYPAINVPLGYEEDKTPFGLSFIGKPFSEPLLISVAYAFEQLTQVRIAPDFGWMQDSTL